MSFGKCGRCDSVSQVNDHPRTRLESSAEPAPEPAVTARPSSGIIPYHLLGNATLPYVPGVTKSLLGISASKHKAETSLPWGFMSSKYNM